MPAKYGKKTYKKWKKNYKRRNRSAFRFAPLPQRLPSRMRYSTNLQLNPGIGGTVASNVFSANSLFDPDRTNVGHQPRGFDEIISLYNQATVVGSKITVRFVNTDNSYAQNCGIILSDSTTGSADQNFYMEQKYVKSNMLSDADGMNKAAMSMNFSARKFFGVTNVLDNDHLLCTASGNPLDEAYFHVWVAPNSAVDSSTVEVQVTIDYLAIFQGQKQPSQS